MAEIIEPGTIVRFRPTGHAAHTYHVRVTNMRQQRFVSPGNREYIVFGGYRVRPADLNVSFGHQHAYTVRADELQIVREA